MKSAIIIFVVALGVSEAIECYNECSTGSFKYGGEEKSLAELADMGVKMGPGSAICSDSNKITCDSGVTECMTVMLKMKMAIGDEKLEVKVNSNMCSAPGEITDDLKDMGCKAAEKELESMAADFDCKIKTCSDGPSCGGMFVSFSLALLMATVARYLF